MIHIGIGILCDSDLIKSGLFRILSSIKELRPAITILSIDNVENFIAANSPSLIILQGETVSIRELTDIADTAARHATAILGLNITAPIPAKNKLFDATVSVYDSAHAICDKILSLVSTRQNTTSSTLLTAREKEIIIGIVKGMSNKEIAASINVSVNTVMTHRRNIASKLQIHSPAGLTIYAIVSKLVSLDEVRSTIE